MIPYEDLFTEPFYQLFRLALLADQMERAGEQGAQRVRVLYVAPARNAALWTSLSRESHMRLADALVNDSDPRAVETIWGAACRRPERFVFFDSSAFVSPDAPTSAEFKDRYAHLAGNAGPSTSARPIVSVDLPKALDNCWSELSWDGPWAAWLPLAWAACEGDAALRVVPGVPERADGVEGHAAVLAWCGPLTHLLGYSFGWVDYCAGLRAWNELGRPHADSRLELIDRWWGSHSLGLGLWTQARQGIREAQTELEQLVEAERRLDDSGTSLLRGLVDGGSDPHHLQWHGPLPPLGDPSIADDVPVPHELAAANGIAVMTFERYPGWYDTLSEVGDLLAGDEPGQQWRIDVVCRGIGWQGSYRRSPVTGRWFAGSHRLHLLGNQNASAPAVAGTRSLSDANIHHGHEPGTT